MKILKQTFLLPQVPGSEIKERMNDLERRRLANESSPIDHGLQKMVEQCNEQYRAIEITTEWINVCIVQRLGRVSIACNQHLVFFS